MKGSVEGCVRWLRFFYMLCRCGEGLSSERENDGCNMRLMVDSSVKHLNGINGSQQCEGTVEEIL